MACQTHDSPNGAEFARVWHSVRISGARLLIKQAVALFALPACPGESCGYLGASKVNTENTLALVRQEQVIEAKGAAVCAGEAQEVTHIPRDRKLAVGWVGTRSLISLLSR